MALHSTCRLPALPSQLHILVQVRLFSSSGLRAVQQYPYPTLARPSPHQIFHLSPGASQKDIKARYYELVRNHHPDSSHCQALTPSVRHARFQSITAAYDILRGKESASGLSSHDPYMEEVLRRKRFNQAHYGRRAQYARPQRPLYEASPDDRWKDRVIFVVGAVTLIVGLAPGFLLLPFHMDKQHRSAVSNLRQARTEARELGEERRDELRKRARNIKMQPSTTNEKSQ
ncbi:hypothetical protein DXG01_017087 [Tephrocybe rancida]|nr:hypothetical protein DXG01_017087 [Tephrocybe rancida]